MEQTFEAFVVRKDDEGFRTGIEQWTTEQLMDGDVTVRVEYSGINYKDALASTENGKIVRSYPFVPGIDLAGTVADSSHPRFQPGDKVLCTGYETGVSHFGGYSGLARLNGDWLVPLPNGLDARDAMAIGTAGFTAALSVQAVLHAGAEPADGPVLVRGAAGGVGSMAVAILSRLGFHVTASSGKKDEQGEWLKSLGAAEVIGREEAAPAARGALAAETWSAVIDPVGGQGTADTAKYVKYGGAIALSGLTGGGGFEGTVYPYILRGVQLIGIDSVYCPMDKRLGVWSKLAGEWKPEKALSSGIQEIGLDGLRPALDRILAGGAVGRYVVKLG